MRLTAPARPCPDSVLALDVSSTACGWAIVYRDFVLGPFGLLKPKARLPAVERIDEIVSGVADRSHPWVPVVMEWTRGRLGRIKRASSLAVLGQAQGAVRECLLGMACEVHLLDELEWTGSRPKAERARLVALQYPDYSAWSANDPGRDVADAIGLGLFFIQCAKTAEMIAQAGGKRA